MRKRSGVPSGELSDTRRLGSADARWYTSQGEKAVFRRRSIVARNAVKTPGETARGAGARPRCDVPRRTRPEVPSAVTVGVLPSGPKQGEASCAGLRPEGIYVYVERSQGRTNRPPCTGSTVAPTVTAHWKANQHRKANTRQAQTHTGQPKLANRSAAKSYVPSCGDGVPDGIITTTQRSNA